LDGFHVGGIIATFAAPFCKCDPTGGPSHTLVTTQRRVGNQRLL
jgi:hypothetical protein